MSQRYLGSVMSDSCSSHEMNSILVVGISGQLSAAHGGDEGLLSNESSSAGDKREQLSIDSRFNQNAPERHEGDPGGNRPHPHPQLGIVQVFSKQDDERQQVAEGAEDLRVIAETAETIPVEFQARVILGRIVAEEVEDEDVPHSPVGHHEYGWDRDLGLERAFPFETVSGSRHKRKRAGVFVSFSPVNNRVTFQE